MHRFLQRSLAILLVAAASVAPASAFAAGHVSVALTAQKVTLTDGHETFGPADRAKPGETLEYRATYRNDGARDVRDLVATLPIPNGAEYVAATATPSPVLASLDGRTYAPVPLTRLERAADGRMVVREVPASAYRSLRWSLGALPAKGARTVTARVRIAPAVAAVAR